MALDVIKDLNIKLCKKEKELLNSYGRAIYISTGLFIGLFLDKVLFYITKGLSVFFPPLVVMLRNKGKVFYILRFEKRFNKYIEKFISHLTK